MSDSKEVSKIKNELLQEISAICDKKEIEIEVKTDILQAVRASLENHKIKDQAKLREEAISKIIQEKLPNLWETDQKGLLGFASGLSSISPQSWGRLSLTVNSIYSHFLGLDNYRDAQGRIYLDRMNQVISEMEGAGLISASYTYVIECDEGGEDEWVDIEKEDIPAEGEKAFSPITGEPDPHFHDRIVRHYSVGNEIKRLYSVD